LVGRLEASELSESFRAERRDGTGVVIKLFHPTTTDRSYARVIAEVSRRVASLHLQGVAPVLQVGLYERRLAIVRSDRGRFSLGQALGRLNTREVVLPAPVALGLVVDLASQIGEAHRADVAHGALTPGNVLLETDGAVVLSDFGALWALMSSEPLRRGFAKRGRSSYRAPELDKVEPPTPPSDVYALGAIAYELLTLKEASLGRAALATRQADKLVPPSRLIRTLHSRIDPIIMRALDPLPTRRQQTGSELAEEVRAYLSAQGGVPGRDDVRKFVDALFPKDVALNLHGPVPFTDWFALGDIEGVSELVAQVQAEDVGRLEVASRAPTVAAVPSVGFHSVEKTYIDTNDNASAVSPLKTEEVALPEPPQEALASWDAPAGAIPLVVVEASPKDVSNRVRPLEDFAPHDTLPQGIPAPPAPQPQALGPSPHSRSGRNVIRKTLLTFVKPFRRDSDVLAPDWRAARDKQRRNARQAVRWGAAILTLFTLVFVGFWLWRSPDPVGDLISWMPRPLEVELEKMRKPKGIIVPPPAPLRSKLPDFDKVNKTLFPSNVDTQDEGRSQKPSTTTCHQPSARTPAIVSLSLPRGGVVEIDDRVVCGSLTKILVDPGKHTVRVIDAKTKLEWRTTVKLEAGKQLKLEPVFRK
jgi:hypothetical protein